MSRPLTIILSPLRGESDNPELDSAFPHRVKYRMEENLEYARACARHSIALGEAPWGSHLLYPQFLDDTKPNERALGLDCERAWITAASHVAAISHGLVIIAVYIDRGFSSGMIETLNWIGEQTRSMKIEFRKLPQTDEATS